MFQLKPRKAAEGETENWDGDDFDIGGDADFVFPSRAGSVHAQGSKGVGTSRRRERESTSSRMSMRSDLGEDEERQLPVPGNDEKSRLIAFAAAQNAGIPLPQNIPTSALIGGTIKRLGGQKVKRIVNQDDWDDDLEFPASGNGGLKMKIHDASEFPDVLGQLSGPNTPSIITATKRPEPKGGFFDAPNRIDQYATLRPLPKKKAALADLSKFIDDEDDNFGGGDETIKLPKRRSNMTTILPLTFSLMQEEKKSKAVDDDFELDLEFSDNKPLTLVKGRAILTTPAKLSADEVVDFGEHSLGTRFGGTRRSVGGSNRSSFAGISPSVSSTGTFESEDEDWRHIHFPVGPLDLGERLKKRQRSSAFESEAAGQQQLALKQAIIPLKPSSKRPSLRRKSTNNDFLADLEVDDDEDVFSPEKITTNRNVKVKTVRQQSPQRLRTVTSLKFTDKPTATVTSRLPRPLGHERHTSSLDPVSESGPSSASRVRRGGGFHTPHSSLSNIPTPHSTPTHARVAETPRRRGLEPKPSLGVLRPEPTTTNAQLLKVKRSLPTFRSTPNLAKLPGTIVDRQRAPSRTDTTNFLGRNESSSRLSGNSRPKTPTGPSDRLRDVEATPSSTSTLKRRPMPFLPAGSSTAQSHHVTIKSSRHFRQADSTSSNASEGQNRSLSRTMSRNTLRSPSPNYVAVTGSLRLKDPKALARAALPKRQITQPAKKQNFGDGKELDGFDDLPTSSSVEAKFIKTPSGRGPPKSKYTVYQPVLEKNAAALPSPSVPKSLSGIYNPPRFEARQSTLPRFAQDTNASRMAREQKQGILPRSPSFGPAGPLGTLTANWKQQVSAKTGLQPSMSTVSLRPRKSKAPVQKRPHLIKPLNDIGKNPKCEYLILRTSNSLNTKGNVAVKGMVYNPSTYTWEGNENDPRLSPFDEPPPMKSPELSPTAYREKQNTTPRPGLITNITPAQGVQIVGGMVFDPQRMCWLKVPSKIGQDSIQRQSLSTTGDTMDGFNALDDDDDDVFKDVPDLDDGLISHRKGNSNDGRSKGRKSMGVEGGGIVDDFMVGEEFDVGPEFVRRQREEEERWRRKTAKWVGFERQQMENENWRWSIRDVVNELSF